MSRFNADKLSWVNKKHSYNQSNADVSIRAIKGNGKEDGTIQFIFRNGSAEKVGSKVEFALVDNCLVFRTSSDGYQLSVGLNSCSNRYMKVWVSNKILETIRDIWVGEYDLQYDRESGLYYIEKQFK